MKTFYIFLIYAQNINCGYPQSMFWSKNKKKVYPCIPQFYYIKVRFKGVYIARTCFPDYQQSRYAKSIPWWYSATERAHGRIQRGDRGSGPPPPGIARLLIFAMLKFSVRPLLGSAKGQIINKTKLILTKEIEGRLYHIN